MSLKAFPILVVLLVLAVGCKKEGHKEDIKTEEELFSLLTSEESGIEFFNRVENQEDFNIFKYRNFYNGGGVAIGDINNDGLADIYFTANMGKNKLFLNQGDFKFKDITESAGVGGNKPWSTGVNMVDINNDGWLDIYVSHAGKMEEDNHDNDLFINNGDNTFTERAKDFNLADTGFSIHASFFDYDMDGDLDAYILNNSNIPVNTLGYSAQRKLRAEEWDVPEILSGKGDMLLRNDDGWFVDVSEEAGIYGSLIGFGLGVMVGDVNGDLYPDIYVTNDFFEHDYLYINNGDGTFSEDLDKYIAHMSLSAMGIDMADINNDGLSDIFVTEMLPDDDTRVKSVMNFESDNINTLKKSKGFRQQYIQNTLQLNNGNQTYSEIAYFSGIQATDWSWSALLFDMNNDGYREIFVTNGINHDLTDLDFMDFMANDIIKKMALTGKKESVDSIIDRMPITPLSNYAFRNNKNLTFTDEAGNWGLGTPSLSNGAAYGDLDNDGDLDLVVSNVNMESFVYRNNSREINGNNFIKLKFDGEDTNRFAIGASVRLYHGDQVIFQEMVPTRGFQSSMEYGMTIGLGQAQQLDSIRVIWPDKRTNLLTNVVVNQTIQLKQGEASEMYEIPKKEKMAPLLKELDNTSLPKHEENNYNDFDFEGLIYKKLSQEGPALAVGDVNGDGNEDIFVGGAKGQAGSISLHQGNGKLTGQSSSAFEADKDLEDTAAAFFDADQDGDLDLMVGAGGNQVNTTMTESLRLYLNDGLGNFKKSPLNFPVGSKNISVIAPHDMDGDGDMDVFVGSRSIIGVYGVDPDHLYLENQGDGKFLNQFREKALASKKSGMITDAEWVNVDSDPEKELVTVSDWGAPAVYNVRDGALEKQSSNLDSLHGWWNVAYPVDIDKDGDMDFIFGNQGTNLHYKPSREQAMRMWVSDFDNNGTIEQIVTQNLDGRDMPIHQKQDIASQMVSLKKENLKASEYATRSIQELFPKETLANSRVKKVTTSQTVLVINDGNGNFSIQALPPRVQFSCVCGITCTDVNNDGNLDIIMGGNNFEFRPQYSRLDANYGNVLLNDGQGSFEWKDYKSSGFFVQEEIKHISTFYDKEGKAYMIVAINNEKPRVFAVNE